MTGTRLPARRTTAAMTACCSSAQSVGASPVVPQGTRPPTPPAMTSSTSVSKAAMSMAPSRNGVTSATKHP